MKGVLRRGFSRVAMNADLPAAEHVPPGSSYARALEAFTLNKILGDRLGFAWRVDLQANSGEPLFHYDQVRVSFVSPFFFFFFFFLSSLAADCAPADEVASSFGPLRCY